MKNSKIYGYALILGTLGGILTMLFHPTGQDLLGQPDEIARRNELITVVVHTLAIISLPLIFFGLLGFSRRLDLEKPLVSAALISYGFGTIMAAGAGIINGLVGPTLTRKINEADEISKNIISQILMNNHLLNQALTKVFVVAAGFALIAWSICLVKQGRLMKVAAVIGFIVGGLSIFGILTGHVRLDVHGFGIIIFAQSAWTVLIAIFMIRLENKEVEVETVQPKISP